MGETPNQKKCCEIVVQLLARMTNSLPANEFAPDELDQEKKATDWHVDLKGTSYWIEHTQIEPYDGALKGDEKFLRFISQLRMEVTAPVPDHVEVNICVSYKVYDFSSRTINANAREAALRINRIIPLITDLNDDQPYKEISININGLEIRILATTRTPHGGHTNFTRLSPPALESLRNSRIEKAFISKLKKFQGLPKRNNKAVLALEFSDQSLSSHLLILDAIDQIYQMREFSFDEVFLIDSQPGNWMAWHVVHGTHLRSQRRQPIPTDWYQ
ncbi:MAG: hypothetical protein KTR23_16705 [Rhodospirillales bacterium]|nr:hypothetical protein [Rhodospirillales bacterium]